MLRITVVDSSGPGVRIHVEGQLVGRAVEELRRSCDGNVHGLRLPLTVDLADVSFADAAGIERLKDLRNRNVTLLNPSPFLALQVKGDQGGGFSSEE